MKDLRRQKHEIHRHAARRDERQRVDQRGRRPRRRREKRVRARACDEEQQHVKHEDAVEAKQPNERRGDDGIHKRLAEVEAINLSIGSLDEMDERRRSVDGDAKLFTALQENAVWSISVDADVALEIAPLVGEVVIVRDAERHHHVRRFIALHAHRLHDVDGHCGGEQRREPYDRDDLRRRHAHIIEYSASNLA